MYHVLLHLHKRLPLGSFFRLLEDGGKALVSAGKLLEVYAREQNREMLRDFYYSDDRRVESAVLCLDEASRMQVGVLGNVNGPASLVLSLQDQQAKMTAVKAAQKFFSEDKDRSFESKVRNAVKFVHFAFRFSFFGTDDG